MKANSSPNAASARIVTFERIPKMTTFISKRQIKDLTGDAASAMGIARGQHLRNKSLMPTKLNAHILCKTGFLASCAYRSKHAKSGYGDIIQARDELEAGADPPQLLVVMDVSDDVAAGETEREIATGKPV
jgi:hypothetical protein